MSWIQKELKRRAAQSRPAALAGTPDELDPARMQALWTQLLALNAELPDALRLAVDTRRAVAPSSEDAAVFEWLRAPNGAALGFAGTAIRYLWPERSRRRSHNFWIRWNAQDARYVLAQRVTASVPPVVVEYRFDERRIEHLLKGLVLGQRVAARALRKKRLWLL